MSAPEPTALPRPAPAPAIFLDRDGTLNEPVVRDGRPFPPATVAEFSLFPDVARACADLAAAGYVLVVATNQPDVGRGTQTRAEVEAMHEKLRTLVPQLAHIEVCYHPGRDPSPATAGSDASESHAVELPPAAAHSPAVKTAEAISAAAETPERRRKPAPGMLLDAAAALHLDLARSWMIGDRWRDIDCGHQAGVRTVFIDRGYAEPLRTAPDFTVPSFADAAAVILRRETNTSAP